MTRSHFRFGSHFKTPVFAVLAQLVFATFVASGLGAQEAPVKIAVVDMEVVFLRSTAGTKMTTELQELQDSTQKELDDILRKMAELEQAMAGKSAEEALDLSRQREDLERNGLRIRDTATRRAAQVEQDSRTEFNQLLEPIFVKLQEEKSFDLMLNKTPGVVIFASLAVDVTQEVIDRLTAPQ